MYNASITYDIGSDTESGDDESFGTLQEAVEWLNRMAIYGATASAWINNKRVRLLNKRVVGNDLEPFCTNPDWHAITDNVEYPIIHPLVRCHPTMGEKFLAALNQSSLSILNSDIVSQAAERALMKECAGGMK